MEGRNYRWYVIFSLLIVTGFVWYGVVTQSTSNLLTVAFLDIGQGDAIYIKSPTGTEMIIDAGSGQIILSRLSSLMPFFDRNIDAIMISNPDKDHLGGFVDVLETYSIGAVIEPGTIGTSNEYKKLEQVFKEKNIPEITALRGQVFDLGGGAHFNVLFPDRDVSKVSTNDGSIVGTLSYGKTSFMFQGDAPQSIEKYLVGRDGKNLDVDVLKVGHHGSRTSTSDILLSATTPEYAVISAGKGNGYGHPHKEVLEALSRAKVNVFGTYNQGTIIMHSDGERVWVEE